MPQTLTIPFHAFKLHLQDGDSITFPLTDANAMHLKKSVGQLANKFRTEFQKKVLDKGRLSIILDEIQPGDFSHKSFTLELPASKDGISFPAFSLELDYFFIQTEDRYWGIVPALGVEAMSEEAGVLEERLKEVVRVDFTSRKRLAHVQNIISAMWFEQCNIETALTELTFYSPAELVEVQKEEKKKLLPKVAVKLEIDQTIAYGRTEEMQHLENILNSNFSKNILLVGASGSGKTALVWELAHRRKKQLKSNFIWETTASVLIKELTVDTGWQDNLSLLVKELTTNGDFLFVRNLAELFEVGQYAGNKVSMAEYLRPYISRGEMTMVTECTPEERALMDVRSPNYLSFFQVVQLEEPKKGLEEIIRHKVEDLAGAKKVTFEHDAIEEVIRLHRRFSPYSGMPGKPIRFLESVLLASIPIRPEKKKKKKRKKQVTPEKVSLPKTVTISRQSVLLQYCSESGLPPFMVDPALPMDVDLIKDRFNQQVYGQQHAVDTVIDMMAAVKTALTRTGKPIASFLFVGPTGVGKTELAKVMAEFMFGSRDRLLRFDMSEFSDPFAVMRLTGQGYFNEGLLTSAVRREPFCVLLFDEIEKADSTFNDLLLQIIGEGRLSDSQGKLVNFCSAIIIMTSNIGASKLLTGQIGWKKDLNKQTVTDHFIREVEKNFKPELFNRIDSVVAFDPLSRETVRAVVEREISLLKKREGIQFRRLELNLEPKVLDYLASKGYDPRYGARYLQRTIREKLIIPMAYTLNQFEHDDQLIIHVVLENGEIELHASSDPLAFDLLMEQWDKLTLADQASNLRRKITMIMEGPIYMRMQSEIDMMESDKNINETAFWQDLNRSVLYTKLLNAKEKADSIDEQIRLYEIEIALAALEQGPFATDFETRLEIWENSFFDLLVEIYSHLFPENNTCQLSIYGQGFLPVLTFYLELVKDQDFLIKYAQAIWYRDGFKGVDDDNPIIDPNLKNPGPYIKRILEEVLADDTAFVAPAAEDRLYGIELMLTGPAVFLYFNRENGLQQWLTTSRDQLSLFHVQVANDYASTPPNIFRQQFYQRPRPRRKILLSEFSDNQMNIQVQIKQKELPGFYANVLDESFRTEIEQLFL